MRGVLSEIPYFKYSTKNWVEKKLMFQEHIKYSDYKKLEINNLGEFETDRFAQRNYIGPFMEIFEEELQEFGKEIAVQEFRISDIWSVQYKTGDFHPVHTHGSKNLSGVLYFDYDPKEHTSTQFVVENINFKSDMTDIIAPHVEEGDFFFFPSKLLHFTLPNKSDKIRRIISLDVELL